MDSNQRYLSPYCLPRSQRRLYHQNRPQRFWPRRRERVRHALPQMPSLSALANARSRSGHRRSSPTPSSRHSFLKEIEALFVQVLLLAREMGVLKMGTVALDGTKIHANASRHSALSHEHAGKIEAQLKARSRRSDDQGRGGGRGGPSRRHVNSRQLARREERLRKIAEARAKIEARARERHAREMAEHEAKMAARAAKTAATGKKPGGRPPQPPTEGPLPSDRVNLTDENSRIMPVAGGGFDQGYNAQAGGRRRQPAGGGDRRGPGAQRQEPG